MREALDAPTEGVSADVVARVSTYFDGQSAVALAVWVRHEMRGVEGPVYDHHLMLGVDDDRYETGDMAALERGIETECSLPGWVDVFPLTEVRELRGFGDVLWERIGDPNEALDPLDFRSTWEPIDVSSQSLETFAGLLSNVAPAAVRVEATHWRLWKGDRELMGSTSLYIAWDEERASPRNALALVRSAAREASISHEGCSLGPSRRPRSEVTVLYDRALVR